MRPEPAPEPDPTEPEAEPVLGTDGNAAEVAPLVTTAIIKDCILVDGVPDVMVTAGDGLVDFPAVLSGLVAGGFRGPLYVECVGGKTPEEIDANVLRTRKYIQGILAGLG